MFTIKLHDNIINRIILICISPGFELVNYGIRSDYHFATKRFKHSFDFIIYIMMDCDLKCVNQNRRLGKNPISYFKKIDSFKMMAKM